MNIDRQIINRALNKAGEEPITDAEWQAGTGTRIRLIKDYYLSTILETLSNTAWTSQKKREKLMPYKDGDNLSDYAYIYYIPGDCAKPIELTSKGEFITEGNFLYTDTPEAVLLYVSNGYTGEYKYKEADPQPTEETFKSNYFYYQKIKVVFNHAKVWNEEETYYVIDPENPKNYIVADPQPTEDTFTNGTYYCREEIISYILCEEWKEDTVFFEIDHEDYDKYAELNFDPLLSEYLETRLAAKMVLKLTGNTQLYQLLYGESQLMEKRAVNASEAHGYNKGQGNKYWGEMIGLPTYGDE